MWFSRARKVVFILVLGTLITQAINVQCLQVSVQVVDDVAIVLTLIIIPAAILVINVVVVAIQVRRAAIHAAANPGVQPPHQSTSAVPTVMLITTSLIYLLLNITGAVSYVLIRFIPYESLSDEMRVIVDKYFDAFSNAHVIMFVYNFYVYLITGKQFRSDVHKLLCRCLYSSSSSSLSVPAHAHALGAHAPVAIAAAAAADNGDAEPARPDIADTAV